MNIHKFIVPFMLGIILLLVGACSKNEQGSPYSDGIVLRFNPVGSVTRTIGSVDPGTDAENTIDNVAIWCYPKNATDDAIPLYSEKITGVNSVTEAKISLTEKKLGAANMTVHGTYDIYVVANLPAEATIGANATLGELKQYSYTVSSRPSSPFSMSGNSIACDFSKGNETEIPLYRHAVKLGITLINETSSATWTINSVTIRNDQKTLYLFQELATASASNAFTTDLVVSTTPVNAVTATYLAYINENLSDVPTIIEVNATIGAENKKYVAKITPDGAAKLVRNSLCKVTLRLKDAIAKVDIESSIVPWEEKSMNGNVPEIHLDIDRKKVTVDPILGGKFNIESNVSTVHIDWSNAPGFYLHDYLDQTSADVSFSGSFIALFYPDLTQKVIADGRVTITIGNLTKEVVLSLGKSDAVFELLSVHIDNIGELADIDGKILPWDYNDIGSFLGNNIKVTINQNITWFYHLKQYHEGETNVSWWEKANTYEYKGIAGATIAEIPLTYNIESVPLYSELSIGVMTWQSNIVLYHYKFIVEPMP